jgi:putative two-component system response regulator
MPAITEHSPTGEGTIMVVDDNPANLRLLEDMLRQHDYEVHSFPRGRLALAAAAQEPPDLILLDINMPEMNGYEVCEQLKASPPLADIPVIFLSALNEVEDKVKGFRSGGVDYISKPFQFEEVRARVETHVRLRRAQQAEHDLLERTLGGAVDTLWELVQLTSPVLALRSRAIRSVVQWLTGQLEIKAAWQFELAATLCLVGCITLPDEVFEKGYCGQPLQPEEYQMFVAHPARAAQLLAKIPRLEPVAAHIQRQMAVGPPAGREPVSTDLSDQVLSLAFEYDRRIYSGLSAVATVTELRRLRRFDARLLDAVGRFVPAESEFEVRRMPSRDLRAGMILETDIMSRGGNLLILRRGTVLTDTWLERLDNFSKAQGAQFLVNARVPRFITPRRP